MKPQNLHTHTVLCDGRSTAREMAAAALAAGCGAIGFSGHAYFPGQDWSMTPEKLIQYRAWVREEQERYAGRMAVYLGLEQDFLSPPPDYPYDYLIGSIHFVKRGTEQFPVDDCPEAFERVVAEGYGGDPLAFVRDYYRMEAEVIRQTGCQIVGHFDLVTKFNEGNRYFDGQSPAYRAMAMEALTALLEQDPIFEINTGAMSRGYRATPYPDPYLLRAMAERGARITLTGDSHHADAILFGYDKALELAAACGVRELWYLTDDGFQPGPFPTLV